MTNFTFALFLREYRFFWPRTKSWSITAEIIGEHGKYAEIKYNFALPLEAMVYEEYLITDGTTLIGSVGGTLGLFIGFSISNIVYSIMDFLQSKTNCYNPFAYKVDLNFLN